MLAGRSSVDVAKGNIEVQTWDVAGPKNWGINDWSVWTDSQLRAQNSCTSRLSTFLHTIDGQVLLEAASECGTGSGE